MAEERLVVEENLEVVQLLEYLGWNQRWSSADSGRRWKKRRRWKVGRRTPWREKRRWFAKIVVHFSSRSFRKDLYVAVFIRPAPAFYPANGDSLANNIDCPR